MGIYVNGLNGYPAVIRRCGMVFEARFIDIPNCVAIASTALEAEKRAQSALASYAGVVRGHAWKMPEPSTVEQGDRLQDGYVAYIKLPPAAKLAVDAVPAI